MSEKIAAVVNSDAITFSDVSDRMNMIIASSGLADTEDIREKLKSQVIGSLIDEQIRLQEARRLNLEIGESEVNNAFSALAKQNKMSFGDFRKVIEERGVPLKTMERQITSQIAWTKVVQQELRPQINISEKDIDDLLARLEKNIGKTEYLVAEIYLPVEAAKSENEVKQLAQKLAGQLQSGKASFFRVAQQFSKAAGAPQGGDMGWVQEGQLEGPLDEALKGLDKDQVSVPVRSLSGYHILLARDKRDILKDNIPSRQDVMNTLGLERLDRLQRRYFMDLKSAAFIENRV